jgi:hypothetical protein
MTGEAQSRIQKFLYNLSTENYAEANKQLNQTIKDKIDIRFSEAIEKVKKQYASPNKH